MGLKKAKLLPRNLVGNVSSGIKKKAKINGLKSCLAVYISNTKIRLTKKGPKDAKIPAKDFSRECRF